MHYRVRYLLDFDLKIRSGQVCFSLKFPWPSRTLVLHGPLGPLDPPVATAQGPLGPLGPSVPTALPATSYVASLYARVKLSCA